MKILAIETSCDETSIAILEGEGGLEHPKFRIISHALLSQVIEHQKYGGVYPNLAKRLHGENLIPILKEALNKAGMHVQNNTDSPSDLKEVKAILERESGLYEHFEKFVPAIKRPEIDLIAVTQGPGLEPALWVGLNFAKALSSFWNIPMVPINHMEGHILSVLWHGNDHAESHIEFPALALLISGGHTQLVRVKNWMDYELLGETRDDAVGEAFDKVARLLGLPYPGGPEISKLADKARTRSPVIDLKLPRPMIDSNNYDFSFSGLKTAVRYYIENLKTLDTETKEDIAKEFEDSAVDVLVTKTKKALEAYEIKTLILGGGVVANKTIRNAFTQLGSEEGVSLWIPEIELSTDNAVMIGITAYLRAQKEKPDFRSAEIRALGNMALT